MAAIVAARGAMTSLLAALAGRGGEPAAARTSLAPRFGAVTRTRPARTRLSLATIRALGAECVLCGGIGCTPCAGSGLR